MEKCIKLMKPGVYKTTFIIDLKDANLSLSVIQQMKGMFEQFGNCYTEMLGICLITNYSWGLGVLWNFVSSLLPKTTAAKFKFLSGNQLKQFAPYIEKSQLLKDFGGDL